MTHHHPFAVGAVKISVSFLDIVLDGGDPFDWRSYEAYVGYCSGMEDVLQRWRIFLLDDILLPPAEFIEKHSNNMVATLFHGLYAVRNSESFEELVALLALIGGDVDSVMSLGMMVGVLYWNLDRPVTSPTFLE